MGGLSTDFGNPWWTKPFVGDAYNVVYESYDNFGRLRQFVTSIPSRARPHTSPSWRTATGFGGKYEMRDIAIIRWRWK